MQAIGQMMCYNTSVKIPVLKYGESLHSLPLLKKKCECHLPLIQNLCQKLIRLPLIKDGQSHQVKVEKSKTRLILENTGINVYY